MSWSRRPLGLLFLVAVIAVTAWRWWRVDDTRASVADAVTGDSTAAKSAPTTRSLVIARDSTAASGANGLGLVFGDRGPVQLQEIPPGEFREELRRLPLVLQSAVLRTLGETAVPRLDIRSLHVDRHGLLFYACEIRPEDVAEEWRTRASIAPAVLAAAVPISAPPVRHSRAGASRVIFLNFSGARITNTLWNEQRSVNEFVCVAYDRDGDTTTFSGGEQADLIEIWERVAEDFRPFDVDVTTERPAVFTSQMLEAVITRSVGEDLATPNPGAEVGSVVGIAYLDVFGTSGIGAARPCFIYSDRFPNARTIANTAAHELGHNLSLRHDGRVIADQQIQEEYYLGHGVGETSWRPIMGSGFTRLMSQWSKGEYYGANNSEDDLAKIAARLSYAVDDHADTGSAATALVATGSRITGSGVIGDTTDGDRFRFSAGAGAIQVTARPFFTSAGDNGADLDLALELFDAAGGLIATADPAPTLSAQLSATVAAGTYILRVRGVGVGNPLTTPASGYSRYGSLGAYTIDGFVSPPDGQLVAPFISLAPRDTTVSSQGTARFTVTLLGSPSPVARWQRSIKGSGAWADVQDDATYSGARTTTLSISNLTTAMTGDQFRCVATNTVGSLTSANAALKVLPGRLAINPLQPTATVSSGIVLSAFVGAAPADPALVFQWVKDGVDLAGETGASLALPYVEDIDAGVYAVRVDDSLVSDAATLTVTTVAGSPTITTHPASNSTIAEEDELTLRVTVAGAAPVSYQWQKDLTDIPGATAATLTFPHVSLDDTGTYTVRVTNSVAAITSKPALVYPRVRRPELVSFPADQLSGTGETVTFAVEFRSATPLQYQWYKYQANAAGIYDRPIAGATGPVLTLTNVSAADGGLYTVRVGSLGYGSVGSTYISNFARSTGRAKLTVVSPWVFVEEPASQVARAGDTVFLRAGIYSPDGTGDLFPTVMQWQKDGIDIAGATSALLSLPNVQAAAQGSYTVRVSNRGGVNVSHPALLTVTAAGGSETAPMITAQPAAVTVPPGGSTYFLVGAASTAHVSYQWQKDGADIPGRTAAILGLSNVQTIDAGAYAVVLTSAAGTTRSASANLAVATPALAAIATQPVSQTAFLGGDVTLSVAVNSATPVTYQWQMAGSLPIPILGATESTLRLTNVRSDYQGDYQVVIFNAGGATYSSVAHLTVANPVPSLTLDDNGSISYHAVLAGERATFYVSPVSGTPISYQWRKDGVDVPGATGSVLTFSAAQLSQQGVYTARVTNASGTVLSRGFNLWVFPIAAPEITTQPASRAVAIGETVTLSVAARSERPLTYQWRRYGQDITDAQGPVLSLSAAQPFDSGSYTVRVSNRSGSVVSQPATVLVGTAAAVAPAIVTPPLTQVASAGRPVTLAVAAAGLPGNPTLGYQWQRNGVPLGGAVGATVAIANLQPANTGIYRVTISGGSATVSAPAIVGIETSEKVIGAAVELGANIIHANGQIYDQVLLQGVAAAITADPGQVVRMSFVDLTGDIVQVEFSGHGTLALTLDGASGPGAATNYRQPGVNYMTGHAGIVISGADETTNVAVFSVGTITALNPSLFRDDVAYDGVADLAFLAIASANGKFGGVRTANVNFYATQGLTGIYAPGVRFTGPVYVGDINASDSATGVLLLGSSADVRVAGGDLLQSNGQAVQVSGISALRFVDGSTSHGGRLPAQTNRARLEQNSADVTAQIVVNPSP
jgi:hypothetical protein